MTNKELAQLLDISPAGLSLVLNNKPGVSEATRKRVLARIEELGYTSMIRKNTQQSANLCFVVYKKHGAILDQHPFFLLLMESIEGRAHKYGLSVLLLTIDCRQPVEPQLARLDSMDARGAVIFATEMSDDDLSLFAQVKMPLVFLDNDFTRANVNTVAINNTMGTYQAVAHLVSRGHTRIGYLQSTARISSFDERHNGFAHALASFGLTLRPEDIFSVRYTEQGSYQDFKAILQGKPALPTAFVADDDTLAIGTMKVLQENGFSVPGDIAIVGFNDRPECQTTQPPLTSVNVLRHSFGAAAVDALMQHLEREQINDRALKVRVSTQLVVRGSTGGA